jgi:hypothetical protein
MIRQTRRRFWKNSNKIAGKGYAGYDLRAIKRAFKEIKAIREDRAIG